MGRAHTPQRCRALLPALLLTLTTPGLAAQLDPTLEPLIVAERGDPLAGSTVGALQRIEDLEVDGAGRVIARAVTGQGQQVVIRDLELLQTLDGTLAGGQSAVSDPYDQVSVSTDGHVAWIARLDGDGERALMFDDTILLAPITLDQSAPDWRFNAPTL